MHILKKSDPPDQINKKCTHKLTHKKNNNNNNKNKNKKPTLPNEKKAK